MEQDRVAGAPLVSVITPTYNNAQYLAECIESVVGQSYQNWEYLIVDDGSSDETLAIASAHAATDSRIVVHRHQERLGVPGNWNRSLGYISPESAYCKFVHADDWLFHECIERMVEVGEAHPSVGLIGAYRIDNRRVNLDGLPPSSSAFTGTEILRATLLGELYVFGSPTSTLIRTDLIRKRERLYDESTLHADTEACFDLLAESDFGFVHQVLTFTRRHEGAVTKYASWLGTYGPSQIATLVRWGPQYLAKDEYERRLARMVVDYWRMLVTRAPRFKDPRFRDFHRRVLNDLRENVHAAELARGTLRRASRLLHRRRSRITARFDGPRPGTDT